MNHNDLKYHLRHAPLYMLWFICGILGVALVFTFFVWFVGMVALMFAIAFVWWATGQEIKIKDKDVVVGYLRWFSYTPVNKRE
jgi:hypothetical protein